MNALDRAVNKASRRLLPFLMLLYIAAFLDRVNIGYVKQPFLRDTGLSEAAFAFGAGLFFVGYGLLEIPSNLMLVSVGARVWIGRIMITWGVAAAAMLLVRGSASFYWLRGILGAMEAGFFPGVILYLSNWFPARTRGPMIGLFYFGPPCAQILGGPVSGLLLNLEGVGGLHGWQWVFLVEGLLAVGLGAWTLVWLTNRPAEAAWLSAEEKHALQDALDSEAAPPGPPALGWARIWQFGLIYALIQTSVYGVTFYLPEQIGHFLGATAGLKVGLVSAVPWACALAAAYVIPRLVVRRSRTGLVASLCLVFAAIGIRVAATDHPVLGLAGLCTAAAGFIGVQPVFWTLPTAELSGVQAATGIALINSLGSLGGFVAPNLRIATDAWWGRSTGGAWALALTAAIAAVLIFAAARFNDKGER